MSEPLHLTRPGGFDIRPATEPNAQQVHDGIWMSEGLSNSFMLTTDDGRVVVNTGMGFEGGLHREAYDTVDDRPITHVIFTQSHVDHVGGADHFITDDVEVLAQSDFMENQATDARIGTFRAQRSFIFWREAIVSAMEFAKDRPWGQATPTPTTTFADTLDVDAGGRTMQLLGLPGGETTDSLAVWLPDERVALVGNAFSCLFGHIPNLVTMRGDRYRSPLAFIDTCNRVLDLEPEVLLTGHFGPVNGADLIATEVARVRDATAFVHDRTVEAMNAGTDLAEMIRTITLPAELAVGEGYGKVSWDVRAIVEWYAGWFHHRSTTELYAGDPTDIAADVVALAGSVDAVAERAASLVRDGRAVDAIRLTDLALAVEPDNASARAAAVSGHEALLDDATNFWEVGWLRHQINLLKGNT